MLPSAPLVLQDVQFNISNRGFRPALGLTEPVLDVLKSTVYAPNPTRLGNFKLPLRNKIRHGKPFFCAETRPSDRKTYARKPRKQVQTTHSVARIARGNSQRRRQSCTIQLRGDGFGDR